MHFIPFLFFCALTYYLWKRHHVLDVAVYMSALFTITTACAVIMVQYNYMEGSGVLFDGWSAELGFWPTLLYCALVSVTIIPFAIIRTEKIVSITNNHRYLLLMLSLGIVMQGLLMYYLVGTSISELLNGEFSDLKNAGYSGEQSVIDIKVLGMALPFRLLYFSCYFSTFGMPLFFYYHCIEKRALLLTLPLLLSSFSPVLRGMVMADRTEIIYFGQMLVFCIIFFWHTFSRRFKWGLGLMTIPAAILALSYVMAVSASRFEESDEGTNGSMLQYLGQSYVNFCYFYDNHNPDLVYVERELPISSFLLTGSQYTTSKDERTAKEGFFIGVFASHVGSWLIDLGAVGATLLCGLFALGCVLIIKTYDRDTYDIAEVFMLFILASVPIFGIFYYRFYNMNIAIQYALAFALYLFSKVEVVLTRHNDENLETEES